MTDPTVTDWQIRAAVNVVADHGPLTASAFWWWLQWSTGTARRVLRDAERLGCVERGRDGRWRCR